MQNAPNAAASAPIDSAGCYLCSNPADFECEALESQCEQMTLSGLMAALPLAMSTGADNEKLQWHMKYAPLRECQGKTVLSFILV